MLKTQADSAKRKILDASELDSSRTITLTNSGIGHYIARVRITPLCLMSKRNRQQLIHYYHPRKTGVKRSLEYVHGAANKLPTEMKDMYTNAPASNISKLPEPFRTAVQNSKLWNWERSEKELETTGCLATLFPKENRQDVSFTIWCGNDDGYRLTNFFGVQHGISS